MIPVVNPTEQPVVIPSNGGVYVFPPSNSKQYWKVVERTKTKVGESPYSVVASDIPVAGAVRGPTVMVPTYVAADLRLGTNIQKGSGALVIGEQAFTLAKEEAERYNALRDQAVAELAKARAELEAAKAELEAKYAKPGPKKE